MNLNGIEYLRTHMDAPESKDAPFFTLFYINPPDYDDEFEYQEEFYIALVPHMVKPNEQDMVFLKKHMKQTIGNCIYAADTYTNSREKIKKFLDDMLSEGDIDG